MKRSFAFQVSLLMLAAVVLAGVSSLGQDKLLAGGGKVDLPPGASGDWWSTVQQNIMEEEYHFSPSSGEKNALYQAPNRAHGFRSYFNEKGVRLVPRTEEKPSWELGLELAGKAEGSRLKADVKADGNRIEINRGDIVEWYINEENGLEQGFTILRPLPSTEPGKLSLDMKLTGNLLPRFSEDGLEVTFFKEGGISVLSYRELIVKDSEGRLLASGFIPIRGGIRISIDDDNAIYPITIDPMLSAPAWTWEPNQALASFGQSVSSAGDVNGDGYSDVIISAHRYDNGQNEEGRVYVFHGSASGLSSSPDWTAESDQAEAYFGHSVSTAGDVNGDGYSDVIIGARLFDNGQTNEGRAFVYHGSSSGLSPTPAWTAESDQGEAFFGMSVSTAGDINGDGYSDVIVGAPYYQSGVLEEDEGAVFFYPGSSSGLSPTSTWSRQGNLAGANFGYSVSNAGDVNGDGYSDIIVGARYYSNGQSEEGRVYVYPGSNKGLQAAIWIKELDIANANFGYSVSDAGDVNGDGYGDVTIAAPGTALAYVYHGSSSGPGSSAAWTGTGASCVSSAGDANGDGFGDIVTASAAYDNGQTDEGAGFVFFGSSSGLSATADWIGESNQTYAYLGSCSSAGDVNGDGFSDILLGSTYYSNGETSEGRAFLYYGSGSGIAATPSAVRDSNQAEAKFGTSVSSAGDVNGDGYGDILVGAPYYDNGQADEGAAFVYYGSYSGPSSTPDWIGESNNAGALFGFSVAPAGDINGDGFGDILVGAPEFTNGQAEEGATFAYYGSATGLSATPDWTVESDQGYSYFGCSVASAGDVNSDGRHDVIVGARYYYLGENWEGAAFVYHGSAAGLSLTPSWTGQSDQEDASYGFSVSGGGDINLDGYDDIIVGAPLFDNGNTDEGAAFVYLGSASGVHSSHYWRGECNQDGAWYGYSLASLGTVNRDTAPEIVIGAPRYSYGSLSEAGRVDIHTLYSLPDQSPEWTTGSDQAGAMMGYSVSSAGDVNGDGFTDLAIGAPYYSNGQANEGRVYLYYSSASGWFDSYSVMESDQTGASLGMSAASAGDVNGDGIGDFITGVPWYDNGQTNEGGAYLFYGGKSGGAQIKPRQFRPDHSAQIVPALYSNSEDSFAVRFNAFSYCGRALAKVEYQWTEYGFFNPANYDTYETDWIDLSIPGTQMDHVFSSLLTDHFFKWRARLKFHPKYGEPILSRWYYVQGNSLEQFDVRVGLDESGDNDGDGVPNETDCAPYDNTVWASPSQAVSNLKITRAATDNFSWSMPPSGTWGSTALSIDILRSDSPSMFDGSHATCRAANLSDSTVAFTDTAEPMSGNVWFYLLRLENGCGTLSGFDSQGTPRDPDLECN